MTGFTPTRRQALAGLAVVPLAARAAPLLAAGGRAAGLPAPAESLNARAMQKGRRFGSAVAYGRASLPPRGTIQNPDYAAIVKAECGLIVPENELQWQWLRRGGPDSFDFAAMDAIVAWAKANGLAVRGHTLLWHRAKWSPEWLNNYDFGANPASEAARLLTGHIRTITDRYRGTILSYDVVNETVLPDGTGLEQTSLSRAMGSVEAVVDLAFHSAREQLPDAELVYNDYMSWEPDHRAHCRAVLKLLEGFRKRGVPVDTLGVQSHIEMLTGLDPGSRLGPYCENEWRLFLNEVVAMGYKLKITEFDVKDKALPGAIALRDAKVAEFARRYFDLMLEYPQLNDILAWGMVDGYSWLQGFAPRDDKREVRGCPYGSDFHRKPLRETLAAVLPAGSAHQA
jgi:endo-1,4-beta-xylanase